MAETEDVTEQKVQRATPAESDAQNRAPGEQVGDIASQRQIMLLGGVVLLALVIGIFVFVRSRSQTPAPPAPQPADTTVVTSPAQDADSDQPTVPSTDSNLPPLYPGVEWGEPVLGRIVFRNSSDELVQVQGSSLESTTRINNAQDFLDYYVQWFYDQGWAETENAGGPNGELYGYEKSGRYFRFGYRPISSSPVEYQLFVEYN